MKSLQDALYNWITIKVVSDARPDDQAAKETAELFEKMLIEEHELKNIQVTKEDRMYNVSFEKDGVEKTSRFPIEIAEAMLFSINSEPEKYKINPEE
jgi:hypothetical protein